MVLVEYLSNFYDIIARIWFFVLIGFGAAAAMQLLIPKSKIVENLGKNKPSTILKSVIAGIVLSACSYGAVPVIAVLRKNGATTASCATMLLSSTWMGLSQMVILTSYVGIINSTALFIASLFIAVIAGLIFARLEKKKIVESQKRITRSLLMECNCEAGDDYLNKKEDFSESLKMIILMSKNLLLGLLIAALIKTFLTPHDVQNALGSSVFSVIYALPIATIIEVVGEGLSVFAGEMYLLGANIGAVFAIIMAGVATDITELSMIEKIFGRKTTTYYIIISVALVVIFSYALNIIL